MNTAQTTTLIGQQELLTENIHEALDFCEYLIHNRRDLIIGSALKRHMAGYAEYGTTMYDWPIETLFLNLLEELADAGVYGSEYVRRAKEDEPLPRPTTTRP